MPIVQLPQGRILGKTLAHGVQFFGGIPYAAPPFGERRFLAPQAPDAWSGVFDARDFGVAAPQAPRTLEDTESVDGGENCLTLNVWTPNLSSSNHQSRLPVLIWIPGGGFMRGKSSDPIYDARHFAAQGIVVVSLNYRIGIDGFLLLDGFPNNRGLLDQLAAIAWIKEHIHRFGGDPEQITLGGVSAGSGAICNLLATPVLREHIQRALLQSPSASCQTLDEAHVARRAIAHLLGCEDSTVAISGQPLHRVVRVVARLQGNYDLRGEMGLTAKNFFPLRPVIDGDLIQAAPLEQLASTWSQDGFPVPDLLVGANRDEMNFYLIPNGEMERITAQRVHAFAQATGMPLPAQASSASTQPPHWGHLLARLQSDYYYQAPARDLARLASAKARAWHYDFAWPSPLCEGRMKAGHATELPFVFNGLGNPRAADFAGPLAPQRLATEMHGAWASFIRGQAPEPADRWAPCTPSAWNTRVFL
jgi:para-nitrobenzyl esterase